ncbi:MAG: hypothetical protein K9K65_05305 [Desulfarculaceae bacterium]|nr:hypothetical protein [Desulfarculaceae bacterium]MCF8046992.1 hypothetical protein [Desulfarculaceae bacterium]MCF8063613.1 hypothetical protein [Desulfarculaceae bacterium]MCF8097240.1 hypothetical protein [Desulfarculaceae bacterium]
MAWKWRDVPGLLSSPNRYKALNRVWHAWAWFPAYPLAWLYRRALMRKLKVVAVVGSTGKTTTTKALEEVLGIARGRSINLNYGLHLVRKLAAAPPWQKFLVLEVGISRAGQMASYASMLRPDVVVATTVGSDHHLSLGGLEGVLREKASMVKALRPGGLVVLNGDDPRVRSMAQLTQAKVIFYGLGPQNQVRAENISLDWPVGSSFVLVAPGVRQPVILPLWGEHFILCALACCAVALHFGRSVDEIAAALQRLTPLTGRMHPVWLADGVCLIEDHHKGTAETFQAALDFMAKVPAKRKVVVMGALETPPGSGYRLSKEFGAKAGRVADLLLVLGSDSRAVASAARKAGLADKNIINCGRSVQAVARQLRHRLEPGDVVLLKGRRDHQLRRITLMLQGKQVSCSVSQCKWTTITCDKCEMLNEPHAQ